MDNTAFAKHTYCSSSKLATIFNLKGVRSVGNSSLVQHGAPSRLEHSGEEIHARITANPTATRITALTNH